MPQVDMVIKLRNVNPRTRRNTLIKWLKREGEPVKQGEPLYIVETHKGVFEVASEFDGTVQKLLVAPGSQVAGLQEIAVIRTNSDEAEAGNDIAGR